MDQRPAVVVEAGSATDVARAVRFARAHGMRIAPQGTGHGAGPLEPLDVAMLLRMTRMRTVHIDPAARTARAEAGAVWQDVIVPAAEHGRVFVKVEAAYLGDAGTGAELTGPLRRLGPELDTFATIPPPALGQLHMDPDQPVPFQGAGPFLSDRPAAAIDALVGLAGPDADTLLASVEVGHLGGALARPAPGGGAQPSIDANYLLTAVAAMPAPDLAAAARAQVRAVKDALGPWHTGYDYYNFEETPAPASAVLPTASYHRLQEIKTAYDPDQVIISTHPVQPTRP